MGRKRGGQRKHWAEEARVLAWYGAVKQCCHWSDYQLDNVFAWREAAFQSRTNADRPRTFEWIRKRARKPLGLDSRWRSMKELVIAVDQHPSFADTRSLYEAELWDLLQETTVKPGVLYERIDRLLRANQLEIINPYKKPVFVRMIDRHGFGPVYDRCLRLSLREMDAMSGIALVWSLHQQAEPAHNWQIRAVIETIADALLDGFFFRCLPEKHLTYYTDAIAALLQVRLDLSVQHVVGYGHLETVGTWPILPLGVIDRISEQSLFFSFS